MKLSHFLLTSVSCFSLALWVDPTFARPQYVAPTGASGCIDCHSDNYGRGYQTGVRDAWASNGLQGLIDFIKNKSLPDTAPVMNAINKQWDITVGETPLLISFHVFDKEDDAFTLYGSTGGMSGYKLSSLYTDSATHLPSQDFQWVPTAMQANKSYALTIYAQESGSGRTLKSNAVSATITVWPARVNASTTKTKDFKLQTVSWKSGKLQLSGQLLFKPSVTAAQKTATVKLAKLQLRTYGGVAVGSPIALNPDSSGNWTQSIALNANQVPCVVIGVYDGLNSTHSVSSAPTTCVK